MIFFFFFTEPESEIGSRVEELISGRSGNGEVGHGKAVSLMRANDLINLEWLKKMRRRLMLGGIGRFWDLNRIISRMTLFA